MKIYFVFADIGNHSDGLEPEDETDVRFLDTFTTKKRAIQELATVGYSYNPNDNDGNLYQIIEHELDKNTLMGTLQLSEQEINKYIPQIVKLINKILQYMKDSATNDKAHLKQTHSVKKWHFEWQDYMDAMVDCLNLQVPMHHGKPDLNHATFVYPERQYPCVAYAFKDNYVEYDDPWNI